MLAFNLIQSRDGAKVDIRKTNAELAEIDAELADLTERTGALRRKRGPNPASIPDDARAS